MSQFIAIYEAWIYLFWYMYRHYKNVNNEIIYPGWKKYSDQDRLFVA